MYQRSACKSKNHRGNSKTFVLFSLPQYRIFVVLKKQDYLQNISSLSAGSFSELIIRELRFEAITHLEV